MPSSKKSKPGLYANIHAKQERVARGSGETMRKAGDAGAPTAKNFDAAAKKSPATRSSKKSRGAS